MSKTLMRLLQVFLIVLLVIGLIGFATSSEGGIPSIFPSGSSPSGSSPSGSSPSESGAYALTWSGVGCTGVSYENTPVPNSVEPDVMYPIYFRLYDGYKWPDSVSITGCSYNWYPASVSLDISCLVIYDVTGPVNIRIYCSVDTSSGGTHTPVSGQLYGVWQLSSMDAVYADVGYYDISAKVWISGKEPMTLVAVDIPADSKYDIEFKTLEEGWITCTDQDNRYPYKWYFDFGNEPMTVSEEFYNWIVASCMKVSDTSWN